MALALRIRVLEMRIMYSGNALIVGDTKFGYAATGIHPTRSLTAGARCSTPTPEQYV